MNLPHVFIPQSSSDLILICISTGGVHSFLLSALCGSSSTMCVCVTVTSGTQVRPAHTHPCQRLLCLLTAARATRLLVIGCVGSIMTLGGGRRQQSMKQNTASCASVGTLRFLRSPLSALNPTKMSESQQGGSNAISQHSAPACAE